MKKNLLLALAFLGIIMSCSKPGPDAGTGSTGGGYTEEIEPAQISLSTEQTTLGGSKFNTAEVTVITNQSKIVPTTEASWMSVGMMGRILIVEATEANETADVRTGEVWITVGEGENIAKDTLIVTQTIRDASSEEQILQITSKPSDLEAGVGSSTFVTFRTNQTEISLTFSTDVSDWLAYEISDGKITFTTLSKNTSGVKRSVDVTVTAGDASAPAFTLQQLYEIEVPEGLVLGALYEGGMIFEIGTDYVKILSLEEPSLTWSSEALSSTRLGTEANPQDGKANTDLIISKKAAIGDFPAAEWCVSLGEGWYMPSVNEMNTIYSNLLNNEGNRARTQFLIVNYGGDLFNLGYYHTCCEHSDASKNTTYAVRLSDKNKSHFIKTSSRYVRAIKKITVDVSESMDKVNGGLGDFNITEESWTNN